MKTINYLSIITCALPIISCSDDDKKSNEQSCECYYTLVENSEPQQGWLETSDTTDCSLDGTKVYYEGWENSNVYYRVLHCQ